MDSQLSRRRQNIVLGVVFIGVLMGALDINIVTLALPNLTHSLGSDLFSTIWAILAYLLVLAAFTAQLGRLGDLYGRGKMFNLGLAIFTIGSAFCGLSSTVEVLIISRVIQAFGGALIQANSSAIIADTFEKERLGRAFGYTAMGWNVGGVIGIVLGGVLTTLFGWPSVFFINIPIGIVALLLGIKFIKDDARVKERLNLPSAAFLATMLALIAYGAIGIVGYGLVYWDVSAIALGAIMLPFYIRYENRTKSPTIHFSMFRNNRVLKFSLLSALLQGTGFFAILFIITIYLQGILGLSPLNAALLVSPGYLLGILSPLMGRLSDRLGAKIVATTGIAITCIGVMVYLTLGATSPAYVVVIGALFAGLGGSMFWPANMSAVMEHTKRELFGSTSGLMRMLTSIGAIFSYAICLTAASLAVPRAVAFQVFIGTITVGNVTDSFITGIHVALLASLALLVVAGIFSAVRGHGIDPGFNSGFKAAPTGQGDA